MKKTRIMVTITAAVLTALVLFGSWMIYDKVAVAAPIDRALSSIPEVVEAQKPVMSNDQVKIDIALSENANIREVYSTINKDAASAIGDRRLELNIAGETDPQLEAVWQSALFAVAEAMENKAYSDIPEALQEAVAKYENITAVTEMDENNVYITLNNGEAVKYIVLPRVPAQLEVWTNA